FCPCRLRRSVACNSLERRRGRRHLQPRVSAGVPSQDGTLAAVAGGRRDTTTVRLRYTPVTVSDDGTGPERPRPKGSPPTRLGSPARRVAPSSSRTWTSRGPAPC